MKLSKRGVYETLLSFAHHTTFLFHLQVFFQNHLYILI